MAAAIRRVVFVKTTCRTRLSISRNVDIPVWMRRFSARCIASPTILLGSLMPTWKALNHAGEARPGTTS